MCSSQTVSAGFRPVSRVQIAPFLSLHIVILINSDILKRKMLSPKEKSKVLEKVRIHDKDTGSAEAQVALFTEEIEQLAKHLKKHKKDNSSRLGLLKMVAKRKRLLDHLKNEYPKRYNALIKKLDLK